ncbi:serine hydrolase domain-containing protein [Kaistella palustris]|uniref:serine hydrolase domain-containing protein n=1 Tax=Kaistella palustris TaxID=493376 RepID=UPI001F4525BF|nr:serine hydrolase domain-containing protein [Kaistella palustris]
MIPKIRLYCIFFSLLLLCYCKSEAEKVSTQATVRKSIIDSTVIVFQQKLLKSQLDSVFAKNKFNGSISVLQNGQVLYEKENGFENFKNKKPLDSNSVFAIGSVSKQFTAVLILLQEEQEKLSTDDRVSGFLTAFKAAPFKEITVKELLNHTSGLSDFGNGLLSEPGTEFHYSNKGFYYLGQIIEKVSGKSYDQNAMDLFRKTGMNNSFTANTFTGNYLAGAYLGDEQHFTKVANMPERLTDKSISVPAGGILSTINDLHRWNNALFNGIILKPASLKKLTEKSADRNHPILGKMGYGFGLMMNVGKPEAYFHTGYVKGAPSLNVYYPATKTSVVVLSNIADESKGKNVIFKTHKEVKKATDHIEMAVTGLRSDMLNVRLHNLER